MIRLIRMVFSNSTMLSVSDKSDSVNDCIQEISELTKLHTQGGWQTAHKFTRQLAHRSDSKQQTEAISLIYARALLEYVIFILFLIVWVRSSSKMLPSVKFTEGAHFRHSP